MRVGKWIVGADWVVNSGSGALADVCAGAIADDAGWRGKGIGLSTESEGAGGDGGRLDVGGGA